MYSRKVRFHQRSLHGKDYAELHPPCVRLNVLNLLKHM